MSLAGSVLSTVVKVVGPALAKALVDSLGIGDKLTNKLLEQAIDVTTDALPEGEKQKALEQQIQNLARRLQEEMQPIFEHEARHLDEGSREAIFLAVAETLLKGSISIEGLMNVALDAERLAKQLLKAHPRATVGFSENEKSLYRQAIAFASASLIETVPQLEGFQLSVTQVMLRQTEELVSLVRSQKELALQQGDQFLARYRQVIAQELDKPDKFGVPLLKNLLSQQRLCEAYVQLSVRETVEESENELELGRRWAFSHRRGWEKRSQNNIEKVLSTRCRLVIRGGAGAGKTSLLHWLAVRAARQNFEAPLQHWNSLVPFFIRLRNWVDKEFPAVKDFVQPIAKNIADEMPAGWVRQQLDSGCALVLIDGVDELPREERQPFFEALQKLVTEFPHAIYITTSRPAGLKDENGEEWVEWEHWVKTEQFTNCVMEPMTLPEIGQFVRFWHRALPEPHRQDDKDPQKIAENLMRQLRQQSEIRQLAATPLLCTMICALHYENEGTLPSTRIRLYDKCVEMLLEERDKQREIKTDINLTLEQKEGFLMEFAYWLMRNNYSDAEVEQADRQFQDYLKEHSLPNVTGLDIRRLLLERSGLLREPLMGRIDFVHRTIQEYLAAKAVLDHEDLGMLLDHADDDQWREALIIAVGKGSRRQRGELLKGLLERGDKNVEKRHYLHLLALACLETRVSIEPDLRMQIEAGAKALLPPKDEEEVATIARAGNEIVPLLGYDPKFSVEEASYCIQALVRIGTPAAMTQLVKYAETRFNAERNKSRTIAQALGQGYDAFEQEMYIQDVLSHTDDLSLRGTQIQDLKPLAELTQLQRLDVSGTQIQDLTPLAGLSQLQRLDVSGTQIQDLTPLAGLTQLRQLVLSGTQIQDLTPLGGLTQLRQLLLSSTQIQDLKPLAGLSQLQGLLLSSTQIQDLKPLAKLTQLKRLFLRETQIQDLTPLAELTQLQQLVLSGTQIQDLKPLAGLSQLQRLDVSGTQIQDLKPLAELTQLQQLVLSGTQIQDLKPLAGLSQLQRLDVSGTQIQDLKPLAGLSQLQRLFLSGTQIQDLTPLAGLSQLQRLFLSGTQIQDLTPLAGLSQLQQLDLYETQVHDFSPLAKLTQKVELWLDELKIEAAKSLKAMGNREIITGIRFYR
jgi:Leucine-rich repeat (LRR) protein